MKNVHVYLAVLQDHIRDQFVYQGAFVGRSEDVGSTVEVSADPQPV